eukprot:COSAG03_NODE_1643_length_3724_cov_24.607005_4_plen_199_part_00
MRPRHTERGRQRGERDRERERETESEGEAVPAARSSAAASRCTLGIRLSRRTARAHSGGPRHAYELSGCLLSLSLCLWLLCALSLSSDGAQAETASALFFAARIGLHPSREKPLHDFRQYDMILGFKVKVRISTVYASSVFGAPTADGDGERDSEAEAAHRDREGQEERRPYHERRCVRVPSAHCAADSLRQPTRHHA